MKKKTFKKSFLDSVGLGGMVDGYYVEHMGNSFCSNLHLSICHISN